MGKTLIKKGDVYNYLTVIGDKPIRENNRSKWLCRCKCGTEKYIDSSSLRSGKSKSCGCYAREQASSRNRKNLVGQIFGLLTVVKDSGKRYSWDTGTNILWECKCTCGNTILVKTNSLTQGSKKSCGCLIQRKNYNGNYKDLTGKKFGHLTILYDSDIRKFGHVYWHCKCDCGQEVDVSSTHLITGETISCGCLKTSKGENKIIEILNDLSINFIFQQHYDDCLNPKNNALLFFDFYLPDYNLLIEYDGEQHFKPTGARFTKDIVEEIQYRDNIKNIYCQEHNIPLIRIPYTDYEILDENYLLKILSDKGVNNVQFT